jgi:hypothetical protein
MKDAVAVRDAYAETIGSSAPEKEEKFLIRAGWC